MAKRKASQAPVPDWAGKDMVCFPDGPRAGEWLFRSHGQGAWDRQVELARFNGETPAVGRTLGYVETNQTKSHREWPGMTAVVMAWAPDPDRSS